MTREDAWRKVKGYLYDALNGEEADEIIQALEQEPCEDAISRQAALNSLIDNTHLEGLDLAEALDAIENKEKLPPVTPQPKTEWIPVSEMLPEKDKEVLIYIDRSPYLATYEDGEWNTDTFTIDPEYEPTIWWELPEPISEDDNENFD